MRRHGIIASDFWNNPHVRLLSDDGKLLLAYVFTCKHGNSAGCFMLPLPYIMADLRWPAERIEKAFSELLRKPFIEHDPALDLILIRGWWGHNIIENPNVAKSVVGWIAALPECALKTKCINNLKRYGKGFAGLKETLEKLLAELSAKPSLNPEPEPEPEPESKFAPVVPAGDTDEILSVNGRSSNDHDRPRRERKKPGTLCPEDFQPSDGDYEFGKRKFGMNRIDVMRPVDEFITFNRGKGYLHADWHQTFRNRLCQIAARRSTAPGGGMTIAQQVAERERIEREAREKN